MAKKGTNKDTFAPDYCPYGKNAGPRGNPDQWKDAFKNRFSPEEAARILGDQTVQSKGEWAILGLSIDSCWDEVKKAYRALAKIHHPDAGGDPEDFKKIHAAYSLIAAKFGAKA